MPVLALQVLGGFELVETSPEAGSRRRLAPQQSALLVFLALAGPRSQRTRDQITAVFWPDLTDARARDALNQSLFRLREALGRESVTREGEAVFLHGIRCDAVELAAALAEHRLEAALDLYRGELLAGMYLGGNGEFERWVAEERDRLRTKVVAAAGTLARQEAERGHPDEAALRLRQALTWSPYEESLARDLIRMLEQLGDRPSAIRVYEGFAQRLRTELELSPGPELAALAESLREEKSPREPSIPPGWTRGPALPLGTAQPPQRETAPTGHKRRAVLRAAFLASAIALGVAAAQMARGRNPAPPDGGGSPGSASRRVAVIPFENETGDSVLDVLGRMAADWVMEGLSRTGLAEVTPVVSIGAALSRETKASILLSGAYYRLRDSLVFRVRVSDPGTGGLLTGMIEASGPAQSPEGVVELVRRRTLGTLAALLDPRLASWARVASRPPSFEAYQLYAAGFDRPVGGRSTSERIGYFLNAAVLDSTFTAPLVWALRLSVGAGLIARADSVAQVLESRRAHLAPWDRAMLDHSLAELRGSFPEAYAAMRRVAELAPNSEWELELAHWALWINRPREALERLSRLDPEQRERPEMPRRYWFTLLTSRHLLDDFKGGLADIARMRELEGENALASSFELAALAALGRVADVSRIASALLASDDRSSGPAVLDLVLELRAHGHSEAAGRMLEGLVRWYEALPLAGPPPQREMGRAIALFVAGRTADARRLFEQIVAEDSTGWTAQGFLAQIAARSGDRVAAERGLRWQLSHAGQWSGGEAVIHAAAIAAELGDDERAVQLARQALARSFYYTHPSVHRQARLEALWRIPAARALLRPRG